LSRQIEHTWLSLSDALLGVAAAKVMAVVSGVVPGFREQIDRSPSSQRYDETRPVM